MTCRHCNKTGSHYCTYANRQVTEDSDGDFFLSAAIGAVTGSAILGGLIGGDIVGGIVGDMLGGDLFD